MVVRAPLPGAAAPREEATRVAFLLLLLLLSSDALRTDTVRADQTEIKYALLSSRTSRRPCSSPDVPARVRENKLLLPLVAGGLAGTAVDVLLFPLDTLKTRMQTKAGFRNAGGFKGVYAGIVPAALGSAPCAALFFVTYEASKERLAPLFSSTSPRRAATSVPNSSIADPIGLWEQEDRLHSAGAGGGNDGPPCSWLCHATASSLGEAVSSVVRVPVENVKARLQVDPHTSARSVLGKIGTGSVGGFYTGFGATICRELPFSFIQFPIYTRAG